MAISSKQSHFELPGFTLPLNWTPHTKFLKTEYDAAGKMQTFWQPGRGGDVELFPNALDPTQSKALPLTPLREFTMLQLMDHLTDKPDWDRKIFDETIAAKWKAEALAHAADIDITESMVDYCIDELRYKATTFRTAGAISVYNGDVVKSDSAVSESLKQALKAAVAPLEKVPERQKDYHPGSDGKVLDLVHPSLFPLIYGRSRILRDRILGLDDCLESLGEGETVPVPPSQESKVETHGRSGLWGPTWRQQVPYSRKFQWLPCDVGLVKSEETVKSTSSTRGSYAPKLTNFHCRIKSYVNNLQPRTHGDLYSVIEHIIARAIPLWNMTLTPFKIWPFSAKPRVEYTQCQYEMDRDEHPEKPEQEEGEEDYDYYDRLEEWWQWSRRTVQPEPDKFVSMKSRLSSESMRERFHEHDSDSLKPEWSVDLHRDYGDRGLQVIVKLANIHLTPDKPEYEGGTWHVEGQLNEHICATALYYYDSENISESRLAFRQMSNTDADINYPQGEFGWLEDVFGCRQDGPGVQEVGDVSCKEGRLLTFPNILQHRVQPFRLQDPTKPGHRKILALFLVDPNIRITSTANVPPQQQEWWWEQVQSTGVLDALPQELKDSVRGEVDFPISLEEAKDLRLELMEERKSFTIFQDKGFHAHTFSLCEH